MKVYTVGPDYAHAEARKSPALDGKVERTIEGKEVRYPVILSSKEKLIARKVRCANCVYHVLLPSNILPIYHIIITVQGITKGFQF